MKNNLIFFGFGLKWKNWIDNPNPKSNFNFGLSITIQSTRKQSNPAIPCMKVSFAKVAAKL
jgi:hypothetical protein